MSERGRQLLFSAIVIGLLLAGTAAIHFCASEQTKKDFTGGPSF